MARKSKIPLRSLGALGYAIGRELRDRGLLDVVAALSTPNAANPAIVEEWKKVVADGHLSQVVVDQLTAFWNDQTTEYDFTERARQKLLTWLDAASHAQTLQEKQKTWLEKDRAWLRVTRNGPFRKPSTARLAWLVVEFNWPPLDLVEITSHGTVLSITTEENATLLEWSGMPEEANGGSTALSVARRMLGVPASILAQVAGIGNLGTMSQYETGTRKLTSKVQNDLERALLLPEGSLDTPDKARQAAVALRKEIPVGLVRLRVPTGSNLQLSLARACIRAVREDDGSDL